MRISPAKVQAIKEEKQLTVSQQQFVDRLAEANIPVAYWFLPLSAFAGSDDIKQAAQKYVGTPEEAYKSLKDNYAAGKHICFAGNYGIGKTYAICSILKTALMTNQTAYYTSLPEMSHMLTSKERDAYLDQCIKSNFLAIDEMDSRHFASTEDAQNFFGSMVEKVIRSRVQNQLPILIGTNHKAPATAFAGQHARVIESLLGSACEVVIGLGKDHRKK